MKKLITFLVIFNISVAAFALPIFQTGATLGQGKYEVSGFYSSFHSAQGYHSTGSTYTDPMNLALGLTYGIKNNIDIFGYLSSDSYPNFPSWGADMETPGLDVTTKVKGANSAVVGIKYNVYSTPVAPYDMALFLEYETASATFNLESDALSYSKDWIQGLTGWGLGGILSRKIGNISPYLLLGYGSVNTMEFTYPVVGGKYPSIAEGQILINVGLESELAKGLILAIEYHVQNLWWDKTKNSAWIVDAGQYTQSGLNIGLKYRF